MSSEPAHIHLETLLLEGAIEDGHAGVAVQTAEGWLLHAGDAYFYRDE